VRIQRSNGTVRNGSTDTISRTGSAHQGQRNRSAAAMQAVTNAIQAMPESIVMGFHMA
jgi:hypothetical protein